MKYLFAILLLYSNHINAQINQPVKLNHYALNEFSSGIVKMKSGESYNQFLNYNILTGEMIFNNGNKYLAIARPENVDTVYISGRKFIPLNNKFYEVLINSANPLLMEFTYTINEPGTPIGYGNTSTTTPAPSIKYLISTGGIYQLQLPDDLKVTPGYTYWIRNNGDMKKFSNAKQLTKILPGRKDALNDFIKRNNTDFSNKEDIIMLVRDIE